MASVNTAQRAYLEQRRDVLLEEQEKAAIKAFIVRNQLSSLKQHRICAKELERLAKLAVSTESHSAHLIRAIAAIGSELYADANYE
ncbi:MAG: hypothetical protein HC822_13575 [Oscillochloris sp.]|nr:hypothetical protein [Oscillochloris sp.]